MSARRSVPSRFARCLHRGRRTVAAGVALVLLPAVLATVPAAHAADGADEPAPEVLARWDLTRGDAQDLSGNGHHGQPGAAVSFGPAGARFDGTDASEITVPYAAGYQPEAAAQGERWRVELDDVVPSAVGGRHRAIIGGRAQDDGWVVYVTPANVIELWIAQNTGAGRYARAVSGVVAAPGRSYDITAEWDGFRASIAVTGAGSGSGSTALNGGYRAVAAGGPIRLGNGGNTGAEFFFNGTVAAATVSILPPVPEPTAEEACVGDSAPAVAPVDWADLSGGQPQDELSTTLRSVSLNASRHTLTQWYPARYGSQALAYLNFGGNGELQIRGPAMVAVGAAVPLATGAYDAGAVGLEREAATDRVVRLVSSLAYRHRANTPGGWGGSQHWQSPLWAYYAGLAGWLLWDDLSPAEQMCVQNMVEYEADVIPDPRYYRDRDGRIISDGNTQAEEDSAWASLLGLATAMMPDHDHWRGWQRDSVEQLLAAYSRPVDTSSEEVLNGRRLSEVLDGSNIENDGTVINHGFLHPIYMLAFDQSVNVALSASLAGQSTPEAAFHNIDVVYDALVDLQFPAPPYRSPGGTIYRPGSSAIFYPQGNDWGTSFPLYFAQADVIADTFDLDDLVAEPASGWADLHTADALAMQRRHADGRTYANTIESNYALREERIAQMAGLTYLTRWLDHQDAVRVTARPYTTAETDPVLGELEAPAAAATGLATRASALEESGGLTADQAGHLRARAGKLDELVEAVRAARSADDTADQAAQVQRALSLTTSLAAWLENQHRTGALGTAAAEELGGLVDSARTALATLHGWAYGEVTAELLQPENTVAPGATVRASVVVDNTGSGPVRDVTVRLAAPEGWTVTPTTSTGTRVLDGREQLVVEYDVTVPEDAAIGWDLAFAGEATYRTQGGGRVELAVDAPLLPAARG